MTGRVYIAPVGKERNYVLDELLKMGVSGDVIFDAADAVQQLGGGLDAVEYVACMVNVFGLRRGVIRLLVDIPRVFGRDDAAVLRDAFSRCAVPAKARQWSFAETAGFLFGYMDGGMSPAEAGDELRRRLMYGEECGATTAHANPGATRSTACSCRQEGTR